MPDNYNGSFGDFQSYSGMGDVTNNSDYSNFLTGLGNTLGYTGNMFNDAPMNMGYNESMGSDFWGTGQQISPDYLKQLQQLSFNPVQGAEDPSVEVTQGNKNIGSFRYGSSPGTLDKYMPGIITGLVTGGFGAGLGSVLGGGLLGNAGGSALASGGLTAAKGGNAGQIGSSALSGGIGSLAGGISSSFNPASSVGISNPTLSSMFNSGLTGAAGAALKGGNILQGGLTSAATTGLNSMGNSFGDLWNSFGGGGDTEFDQLEGSGGNFNARPDPYGSNTYDEASPDYRYGGAFSQVAQPGMKTAQSASSPIDSFSFSPGNIGSSVGNYLGSHGGDLASMLYGFYNNKKQQRALQGQQEGLQGLYGQNSPYAQQLRNTLQAKAAQGGKRLNTGAREVQLQAMLADRAAQTMPQQFANQMAQGKLQNSMGSNMLNTMNKMGAFKAMGNGLQNMFGTSPVMQNGTPYQNYFGDYNSLTGEQ